MDLPDDLADRIRESVRRSLLPGAAMPADGEGLYGRVDPARMDRELERLGYALRRFVPRMNDPFGTRGPSSFMVSLQLLAPLWPKAERARQMHAQDFDNPTIESVAASVRRGTFIRSHVPGHEARFPARSAIYARRMLVAVLAGPSLSISALGLLTYSGCNPACGCRSPTLADRLIDVHWVAMLMTVIFLSLTVLPGVVAVALHWKKLHATASTDSAVSPKGTA